MKTALPILSILALLLLGCSGNEPAEGGSAPPKAPIVNESSTNLFFSWFEGDESKTAQSPMDVPEERRKGVRVQDPNQPPDERNPDWVFLADLNKKDDKGNFPVEVLRRTDWEKRRRPQPTQPPLGDEPSKVVGNGQKVIMYATKTCPVCIKARRWLVQEKIPFEEKDVGSNMAAATELAAKGRAQGVPTTGVPVFDVGGRLVPGFDKNAIRKLMSQRESGSPDTPSTPSPKTAPPHASPADQAANPPIDSPADEPVNPPTKLII